MGYDLYGMKPTAPEGEYFRRNVWRWAYMVHVWLDLAPRESRPCGDWYGERCWGNGMSAKKSLKLAAKLDALLASGEVAAYLGAVPGSCEQVEEPGETASATAQRREGARKTRHFFNTVSAALRRWMKPNMSSHVPEPGCDEDDIREFVAFLKTCGGFSIS